MSRNDTEEYGSLSLAEYVSMIPTILALRQLLLLDLTKALITGKEQQKSTSRLIVDSAMRFVSNKFSYRHLQLLTGSSLDVYTKWAKKRKLPVLVDETGESGRIFWLNPKEPAEKVIFFIHGGAYLLPLQHHSMPFLKNIQDELETQGLSTKVAIFSYSPIPDGRFPVPLRQAVLALQHIIQSGIDPGSIYLAGDSAGANLVLQVLSHLLHPRAAVPTFSLPLGKRLAGAVLISPWIGIDGTAKSFELHTSSDVVSVETLRGWAQRATRDIGDADIPFFDVLKAPNAWYQGLDTLVERILVTTGDAECLRDPDVTLFNDYIRPHLSNCELYVQPHGVHDDMIGVWLVGEAEGKANEGSKEVIRWFKMHV